MICNEICLKYKTTTIPKGGRYLAGQRRCTYCDIFIEYDGMYCPCCGIKLRMHPKNKKLRMRLNEITIRQ